MRKLLTALAVAGSITVVACGGAGIDQDEAEQLQERAAEIQKDAQKTADEVRAGTKDAEQAAHEIREDMTGLADDTIDAAEDADLPPEAREQLEAAQEQLDAQR